MKKCKHNFVILSEGLSSVCNKCGIVNVDGGMYNKKDSLKLLIRYANIDGVPTKLEKEYASKYYKLRLKNEEKIKKKLEQIKIIMLK